MKRSVKALVTKAVCKCKDWVNLTWKYVAARLSAKVLMIKAVRRCPGMGNVRVLDTVRGVSSREAQCRCTCCRRDAMVKLRTNLWGRQCEGSAQVP